MCKPSADGHQMLNAKLQMFEAVLVHKGWNNSTARSKADGVNTSD